MRMKQICILYIEVCVCMCENANSRAVTRCTNWFVVSLALSKALRVPECARVRYCICLYVYVYLPCVLSKRLEKAYGTCPLPANIYGIDWFV